MSIRNVLMIKLFTLLLKFMPKITSSFISYVIIIPNYKKKKPKKVVANGKLIKQSISNSAKSLARDHAFMTT